jgi:hypothetical protein
VLQITNLLGLHVLLANLVPLVQLVMIFAKFVMPLAMVVSGNLLTVSNVQLIMSLQG